MQYAVKAVVPDVWMQVKLDIKKLKKKYVDYYLHKRRNTDFLVGCCVKFLLFAVLLQPFYGVVVQKIYLDHSFGSGRKDVHFNSTVHCLV